MGATVAWAWCIRLLPYFNAKHMCSLECSGSAAEADMQSFTDVMGQVRMCNPRCLFPNARCCCLSYCNLEPCCCKMTGCCLQVYGANPTGNKFWKPKKYKEGKGRYLWTDAFGVCNFITLYCERKDVKYLQQVNLVKTHFMLVCTLSCTGSCDPCSSGQSS